MDCLNFLYNCDVSTYVQFVTKNKILNCFEEFDILRLYICFKKCCKIYTKEVNQRIFIDCENELIRIEFSKFYNILTKKSTLKQIKERSIIFMNFKRILYPF